MALKNMIKVGDRVAFGRSGEKKQSGTVVKTNPKTARIKVPRCGLFDVTYNLIQKPRKKAPAKKKAIARRKPAGKQVCAVPVKGGRIPRAKSNPSDAEILKALSVISRSWVKKQKTAQLDALGQALVNWVYEPGEPISAAQLDRLNKKLDILMDELETRSDWRGATKLNPPKKGLSGIRAARKAAMRRRTPAGATRTYMARHKMMTGGASAAPVRPADRVKEELILQLMKQGMSRSAAKARVARISQTPREVKPKVKDNPYEFGQESRKVRRKTKPEWGEDTLGFASTEPDLYEEEETGNWRREQTTIPDWRPNPVGKKKRFRESPMEVQKRRAELLGIDTSKTGWRKEYARRSRKHIIKHRHLASQGLKGGATAAHSTLGYDIDDALEGAVAASTVVPKSNPPKYAVIVGDKAFTAYTMEEANIMSGRRYPGKEVKIYSMATGKLVRTIKAGSKRKSARKKRR